MAARALAAVGSEWVKLMTLPAARLTAVATVVVAGLLGAALASMPVDQGGPGSVVAAVLQAVPYLQAGAILFGLWPVAHEYAGRQIGTTLVVMPGRVAVVTAKTVAITAAGLVTGVAAVAAAFGGAALVLGIDRAGRPGDAEGRRLVGAVVAFVLVCLLAHAVALLLPRLVPTLVTLLCLVYLVPPLAAGLGEHTRWLPSVAAAQLHGPTGTASDVGAGVAVVLGWIVLVGLLGTLRFVCRDA